VNKRTLIVEGWRGIPQSYTLVNHFQLVEMLRRGDLQVYHLDVPFHYDTWRKIPGLFDKESEEAVMGIPAPPEGVRGDAIYRISYPYDLSPAPEVRRLCVFGTAEYRCIPQAYLRGQGDIATAQAEQANLIFVTSSHWSREGFIASGADPQRVFVVPLGADVGHFKPAGSEERVRLRKPFGLEGFVFLTVGALTENKGIDLVLKGFARVAARHPQCRLVIKGIDAVYPSRGFLDTSVKKLSEAELAVVQPRMRYVGESLGQADMARVYQVADAYVSPYRAEGFNLPVLEAAACGLPVICTEGGSTDDFTTDEFSLAVKAEMREVRDFPLAKQLEPDLESLVEQMMKVVERPEIGARAKEAGPKFAAAGFTWKQAVERLMRVIFPI